MDENTVNSTVGSSAGRSLCVGRAACTACQRLSDVLPASQTGSHIGNLLVAAFNFRQLMSPFNRARPRALNSINIPLHIRPCTHCTRIHTNHRLIDHRNNIETRSYLSLRSLTRSVDPIHRSIDPSIQSPRERPTRPTRPIDRSWKGG